MAGLVLVAEDEGLSQRLVSAVIQYCGMDAKITQNGQELLDELRAGLAPDIILLDLEMPVMGGIEVLKTLQSVHSDDRCPILVFTANNHEATVREAILLGADDFVVKPFKTADLAQRIKDHTFTLSEAELKRILFDLDRPVADMPNLKKKAGQGRDLYRTPMDSKLALSLPRGQSPQLLAAASLRELRAKVVIYREGDSVWRKVWPRSGRTLWSGLTSA